MKTLQLNNMQVILVRQALLGEIARQPKDTMSARLLEELILQLLRTEGDGKGAGIAVGNEGPEEK